MYRLHHVLREVAANAAMGAPPIRALRTKLGRTSARDPSVQARAARAQFDFFMSTLRDVRDKVVAEIGPGDAIAVGAQFLAAGAARYVAFDRFAGDIFGASAQAVYRELDCVPDPLRVLRLPAIESESAAPQVDIIVSFNVLEHVADPYLAIRNMVTALKPDGMMIHRIDYGPHDIWRAYDDPLTFLTIPEWLWKAMGSNRGYPNRARHHDMTRHFSRFGMNVTERITKRHGPDVLAAEIVCSRGDKVSLGQPYVG